jgi:hypothetical protein
MDNLYFELQKLCEVDLITFVLLKERYIDDLKKDCSNGNIRFITELFYNQLEEHHPIKRNSSKIIVLEKRVGIDVCKDYYNITEEITNFKSSELLFGKMYMVEINGKTYGLEVEKAEKYLVDTEVVFYIYKIQERKSCLLINCKDDFIREMHNHPNFYGYNFIRKMVYKGEISKVFLDYDENTIFNLIF